MEELVGVEVESALELLWKVVRVEEEGGRQEEEGAKVIMKYCLNNVRYREPSAFKIPNTK